MCTQYVQTKPKKNNKKPMYFRAVDLWVLAINWITRCKNQVATRRQMENRSLIRHRLVLFPIFCRVDHHTSNSDWCIRRVHSGVSVDLDNASRAPRIRWRPENIRKFDWFGGENKNAANRARRPACVGEERQPGEGCNKSFESVYDCNIFV